MAEEDTPERVVYLEPHSFQVAPVTMRVRIGEEPPTIQSPVVTVILEAGIITPGISPEKAQIVIPIPSIEAAFEMGRDIRDAANEALQALQDPDDELGEIHLDLTSSGGSDE